MLANNKILSLCKFGGVFLVLVCGVTLYIKWEESKILDDNDVNDRVESNDNILNDDVDGTLNNENNVINEDNTIVGEEDKTEQKDEPVKNEDNNSNADVVVDNSSSNNSNSNIVNNDKDISVGNGNIVNTKKIILEDRTNGSSCAQAIEYFYEDSKYRYYFTCIKSNSMYVIVNGVEYKLVDALENGIVTIKELENNGYKFLKKSKNAQIR